LFKKIEDGISGRFQFWDGDSREKIRSLPSCVQGLRRGHDISIERSLSKREATNGLLKIERPAGVPVQYPRQRAHPDVVRRDLRFVSFQTVHDRSPICARSIMQRLCPPKSVSWILSNTKLSRPTAGMVFRSLAQSHKIFSKNQNVISSEISRSVDCVSDRRVSSLLAPVSVPKSGQIGDSVISGSLGFAFGG